MSAASRPSRLWGYRLGAIALAILATMLITELGLRLFGPRYYRFRLTNGGYYSNPRGYFEVLEKDAEGRTVYGVPMKSTFRPVRRLPDDIDGEADLARHYDRDYRILGLGDSFTLGLGVRYEDIYLRRLEKLLAEGGRPVAIRNAGVSGYDLDEVISAYRHEASPHRYNLVLYGFVLNDFGLPGKEKILGSDFIDINNGGYRFNPWRERSALVNFAMHTVDAVRLSRLTQKLYLDAYQGENWQKRSTQFKAFAAEVRRQSDFVVIIFPLLFRLQDYPFTSVHEKVAQLCREQSVPVLDLLPAFQAYRAEELWVHPTDHHPNEIGHMVAAKEIYRFLDQQGLLDRLDRARGAAGPLSPASRQPPLKAQSAAAPGRPAP